MAELRPEGEDFRPPGLPGEGVDGVVMAERMETAYARPSGGRKLGSLKDICVTAS